MQNGREESYVFGAKLYIFRYSDVNMYSSKIKIIAIYEFVSK
jgi:hypothetical protein